MSRSALEDGFLKVWESLRLGPMPEREFRFYEDRKWRFDCCWPHVRVAVELEGGIWGRGRHTRGSGYQKDLEKYNAAAMENWSILRYTSTDLKRRPVQICEEVAELIRRKS